MSDPFQLETIYIQIDPETSEYKMDVQYVSIERLYAVLKDICYKIENGKLGPDVRMEDENGRELGPGEFRGLKDREGGSEND